MSITRAAIDKNRITTVALAFILVGGVNAYFQMPRAEDPGFVVRAALVTTFFPGASPERIEQLVTDRIEKAVQEIPELDEVVSESRTGVSVVYVLVQNRYDDMYPIWTTLRRKIERVAAELPEGSYPPIVNDEFGDVFGTLLSVSGDDFNYAELKSVADEIREELLRLDDVAKVEIFGAQEERVFVEYNNARLAELGLSPAQLRLLLESQNVLIPGGVVRTEAEQITLEPSGSFDSVEDLRRSVIALPGSQEVVHLEDLAAIRRGYVDPPRSKAFSSGSPALVLAVSLREGGNILTLGEGVRDVYRRAETAYPIGVDLDLISMQSEIVDDKVNQFVGNVFQAVGIVVLVMLITLGVRTGLVVATLIPVAMIMSVFLMPLFGIGLNQMSLASLIVALGMLVDNAIVMSESIMVQMRDGKERLSAAVDSARELGTPLLVASLTTAAAFLPFFLAESDAGEYTGLLFTVVTITLLSSWLLSVTMVPLLCVRFLRVEASAASENYDTRFYRTYRGLLLTLLRHRAATLGAALIVFALAMSAFRLVPNIFFPSSDRALLTADLQMPTGTPIDRTESVVRQIQHFVDTELGASGTGDDGVVSSAAFVGVGAPRYVLPYTPPPPSPELAYMMLNTTSREVVDDLVPKLEAFTLENFPDLTANFAPPPLGPPVAAPVEVRVSGRDVDRLFSIVDEVKAELAAIEGTRNVVDDWGRRTKKIMVNVSQPRARRAGVSSWDIAVSLQTVLSGFETTEYREGRDVIPVVMRSVAADREDVGKIESLNVFSQATGRSVPLRQVADLEVVWQPAVIFRRGRLRTVTVSAHVLPGVTAMEVDRQIGAWLEERSRAWPLGYQWELGGEMEASGESEASIAEKLPIAFLIIVLLLVGQFNSIRRPAIVLMTIPLGLIGVVIGLLLLDSYFGFMTLLGVVSLAGIVINNAIVLLDRIRLEQEENGRGPQAAILEAAQRRLRPILLTTATTIGGLLPLYLGGGPM
ncbi:MAG: efflux RND transporter permease subunit, partial [Gemmatimonadota bacterium]|nr:efflux RND transporter permease subunit [Gemmatimonadota bacterium]